MNHLSCCFHDSVFPLSFECLITMCLGVGPLNSSYLGFLELLGCLYSCLSRNSGSFHLLFFSYSLSPFSLLTFWYSHSECAGLPMLSNRSLRLCLLFFYLSFFLFLIFNNFYCPIFKLMDSFFSAPVFEFL